MQELQLQRMQVAKVKAQLTTLKPRRLTQRLVRRMSCAEFIQFLKVLQKLVQDIMSRVQIFRSTVDHSEPPVEGGALGFRGLRGL